MYGPGVDVLELWRFPVKSLQGERVEQARLTRQGIEGDRRWALFDDGTGFGLTARRAPELLFAQAAWRGDDRPSVTLPDGSDAPDDEALSRWLGRAVTLRPAQTDLGPRRYENLTDAEDEDAAWEPFDGAHGAFHDTEGAPVSLLTRASTTGWQTRRFRANVVLDGSGEDELVGSRVKLGQARLDVALRIVRCVMVTRPQPAGIDQDSGVLRTIVRERGSCLSVGAAVVQPGAVRVGDPLQVGG